MARETAIVAIEFNDSFQLMSVKRFCSQVYLDRYMVELLVRNTDEFGRPEDTGGRFLQTRRRADSLQSLAEGFDDSSFSRESPRELNAEEFWSLTEPLLGGNVVEYVITVGENRWELGSFKDSDFGGDVNFVMSEIERAQAENLRSSAEEVERAGFVGEVTGFGQRDVAIDSFSTRGDALTFNPESVGLSREEIAAQARLLEQFARSDRGFMSGVGYYDIAESLGRDEFAPREVVDPQIKPGSDQFLVADGGIASDGSGYIFSDSEASIDEDREPDIFFRLQVDERLSFVALWRVEAVEDDFGSYAITGISKESDALCQQISKSQCNSIFDALSAYSITDKRELILDGIEESLNGLFEGLGGVFVEGEISVNSRIATDKDTFAFNLEFGEHDNDTLTQLAFNKMQESEIVIVSKGRHFASDDDSSWESESELSSDSFAAAAGKGVEMKELVLSADDLFSSDGEDAAPGDDFLEKFDLWGGLDQP
ncbi:MAG: hypothetical protein JXR42_05960 [Gammaproteobacteria bacterium]|nr:hypothetical protein [Gammaproteobacteria bacterium]